MIPCLMKELETENLGNTCKRNIDLEFLKTVRKGLDDQGSACPCMSTNKATCHVCVLLFCFLLEISSDSLKIVLLIKLLS